MRARVARNVAGWNLPPKMDKDERLRFETTMVEIFEKFGIPGKYHSLTPGHKNFIDQNKANELIKKHFLFNDMTTDNHLTSSGVASDWPHGRGIWVSEDETKMIWIGEEDQLRIISIVKGLSNGTSSGSETLSPARIPIPCSQSAIPSDGADEKNRSTCPSSETVTGNAGLYINICRSISGISNACVISIPEK